MRIDTLLDATLVVAIAYLIAYVVAVAVIEIADRVGLVYPKVRKP